MSGNAYPAALRRVIVSLSRWPGVGEKTASRLAMHLLRAPESEVLELAHALMELKEKMRRAIRASSWWWRSRGTCWLLKKSAGTRASTTSWVG
jgi:hypothetical protein